MTLGFIAESLREHLTERAKEKQYIEGFVRNLKDDTASLRHVIWNDSRQAKGVDSMLMLAHASTYPSIPNRRLFYYFFIKYCYSSSAFKSNDATLQQLKSTGDYRLNQKKTACTLDSLSAYDRDVHGVYGQGDYYEAYFKEVLSRLDELADVTVLGDSSFIKNGKMTDRPFPQFRAENGKLTTFFNKVFVFKIITASYVNNNLQPQLERLPDQSDRVS